MAIFTAIGTAIAGALFAGSALAATVISSGLAFAANLGISYLRRPKKRKYAAVQGETQYGGDVPVGALFGTGKTKGQRIFYAKWGSGNKVNAEVFVLANGWNDGLEPYVYFFGKKHNLVVLPVIGNEAAHYGVEGFANNEGQYYLSFRFYDGRPGQGVDQKLVDDTAALGQTWKATSVNAGLCYVVVQRVYDGDLFRNGKPDIEFVLRGLREYDPRKDSTVAGGSGPQRINDPATWTHQLNPAVHRLNYQLGLKALISGRTLIGEGKSLGQLDLGTYFVAMNVCDTLRSDGKKTYQCSLWVTGDDDHTEILKEFDDAMAGYGINRRGLSGVIPGAPQIPVMEITADDIPADRAKEIQYRKSAFERYNYLSGQFLSIELMWNPDSLTPVYVNAHVSEDGRPRQTSNDFLQVTDPDIAQYLLYIRYRQNRMGGTATLPVSRRVGLKVQEGEWITWRGRSWMISEWMLDEQFRVTLKLSETSADIYDDEDIEPGPVVIPPTPPVNPSLLSTVQNFGVEAGVITNSSGADVPALKFTWDPPADPSITAVRFFYRPNDDGTELFEDQCNAPETGFYITTKNVVSDEVYIARATITIVPDRLKTYTGWVVTNDPTGTLYADVLDNSITAEKIANAAVTAAKIMDETVTNLKLANEAVSTAKLQVGAVTAQILADQAVISAKLADAAVTAQKLAAGAVDATKFASGIRPVEIVSALPSSGNFEGRMAFLTTDDKLYRYNGSAWVASIEAGDITGAIVSTQIADNSISTPKLAANAVTTTKLDAFAVTADKLSANSVIAGKIAAGAVSADQLAANAVIAGKIAAGAVTATTLAVGTGKNQIPNSDFRAGTTGFGRVVSGGSWSDLSVRTDHYGLVTGSLEIIQGDPPVNDQFADVFIKDAATGNRMRFSVGGGERYEASIYVYGHRSNYCRLHLQWLDLNGNTISYSYWDGPTHQNGDPDSNIANYLRIGGVLNAPPNARSVEIFYRTWGNSAAYGTSSFTWLARPYFGEATVNQTELSEWSSSGVTLVENGYIVTGAINARTIAASAITAEKISAGAITAEKIAASAVTADKIAAASITGAKIAANTIGADKIAADSITAKHLVLTNFNNLVPDSEMMSTEVWVGSGWQQWLDHNLFDSYNAFQYHAGPWGGAGYGVGLYGKRFPVKGGVSYRFAAQAFSNDNFNILLRAVWFDANNGLLALTDYQSGPRGPGGFGAGGDITAPANAVLAQVEAHVYLPNTGGPVYVGGFALRERNAAELIVDGTITANKLNVNSLSAITANFGDAYFSGYARSINGKMQLDFNNGYIIINS